MRTVSNFELSRKLRNESPEASTNSFVASPGHTHTSTESGARDIDSES
ncbi:hypothetical protein R80B4_02657 [Fibrobacteres bacterium R8-0-B4]